MGCKQTKCNHNEDLNNIPSCSNTLPSKEQIESDTYIRRTCQHFSANVIREEYSKDVSDFYIWNSASDSLGNGVSGSVVICRHKKTNVKYAMKILSKKNMTNADLDDVRAEITIMSILDHPNIIRLHECFETTETIYLILELCTGGDLYDGLQKQKGTFTEDQACKIIHKLLSAICYCHQHSVVHRDVKLENILFLNDEKNDIKLIDFGLSRHFKPDEIMNESVGTPYYIAPEVLNHSYNCKCDVWSVGVITYMLLSGKPVFFGLTNREIYRNILKGKYEFNSIDFGHVSSEAKDFISACLTMDAESRPSALVGKQHAWFRMHMQQPCPGSLNQTTVDCMKRFQSQCKLTRLCMQVVALTLDSQQIKGLLVEFQKADEEETGEVSLEALRKVLEDYHLLEEELISLFSVIDFDDTGTVKYHEFVAAALNANEIEECYLRMAFEKLSKHEDFFTASNIKEVLGADVETHNVSDMMREMCYSPTSKRISYEEFETIVRGYRSPLKTKGTGRVSPRFLMAVHHSPAKRKLSDDSSAFCFSPTRVSLRPASSVVSPRSPEIVLEEPTAEEAVLLQLPTGLYR